MTLAEKIKNLNWVNLINKLKDILKGLDDKPSGGGGIESISGDYVDNTDPLNPILEDPRPYKVYTALLSQSGTDAPVATVLENTLGGDIVWTRDMAGQYTGTLADAFLNKNVALFYNQDVSFNFPDEIKCRFTWIDDNTVVIETALNEILVDDLLFYTSIKLEVYDI
jgi:hypothetical protein